MGSAEMRGLFIAIVVVIGYLVYGLYISEYDLRIIPKELATDHPPGFHDYKGVTNVHSNLSSGSGDIMTIIRAAQAAELDFISFTDLNVFDPPKQFEGEHGSLVVFIDGEYSYLNSRLLNYFAKTDRHLQGVGRSQVLFSDLLSERKKADDLGIFVLAHPFKPHFRWTGDYPIGLDGLEIINLKSVWQQAWLDTKISFLWSLFVYPFNERLALIRLFQSPDEELHLWDELTQKRPTIGIAGADAEAKIELGQSVYLRFPSYESVFRLVRNHILIRSELTGNPLMDADKISRAIRNGQFYMSLDILADPKGFNAYLETADGEVSPLGSEAKIQKGMKLVVILPQKPRAPFDVNIYRNGEKMMTSNSQRTDFFVHEPGVYRVMVRVIPTFPLPDGKKWVPWIFTNPFYVR
jgi:hypothetical protein